MLEAGKPALRVTFVLSKSWFIYFFLRILIYFLHIWYFHKNIFVWLVISLEESKGPRHVWANLCGWVQLKNIKNMSTICSSTEALGVKWCHSQHCSPSFPAGTGPAGSTCYSLVRFLTVPCSPFLIHTLLKSPRLQILLPARL